MPTFLSERVGPFPTWLWIALGTGLVVLVRARQAKAAQSNVIAGGELSPEYAPGYPGNDALGVGALISGPPPIGAVSQVAGTSTSSPGNAPTGGRTPLQVFNPTNANGTPVRFFPR